MVFCIHFELTYDQSVKNVLLLLISDGKTDRFQHPMVKSLKFPFAPQPYFQGRKTIDKFRSVSLNGPLCIVQAYVSKNSQ
jgi:hypothetical protein